MHGHVGFESIDDSLSFGTFACSRVNGPQESIQQGTLIEFPGGLSLGDGLLELSPSCVRKSQKHMTVRELRINCDAGPPSLDCRIVLPIQPPYPDRVLENLVGEGG